MPPTPHMHPRPPKLPTLPTALCMRSDPFLPLTQAHQAMSWASLPTEVIYSSNKDGFPTSEVSAPIFKMITFLSAIAHTHSHTQLTFLISKDHTSLWFEFEFLCSFSIEVILVFFSVVLPMCFTTKC